MRKIIISDIIKPKVAVEPREPTAERVEHLCQGWVNVKVVFTADVLACECAKVDFVEAERREGSDGREGRGVRGEEDSRLARV